MVRRSFIFLSILIALDLGVTGCHWMMHRRPDWFILILLTLLIALLITLYGQQYIEFENSGLVISIRKRPLIGGQGFVRPMVEFPSYLLEGYELRRNMICLKIGNDSPGPDRTRYLKIGIRGFKDNQIIKVLFP